MGAPMNPLSLIVVDDYPDCSESLALLLNKIGHRASLCHSARETLEQLEVLQPDALLLDIGMPGVTGLDLARMVKQITPALILIAVTGFVEKSDRQEAANAGFDYFIPKPVDFGELCRVLDEIAVSWNIRNRNGS